MITQQQTQQQFGFVNGQFEAGREAAGEVAGRARLSLESDWDEYAAMVVAERPDLATVALLGYN